MGALSLGVSRPLVLVAARMSSSRLPGKTLMTFGDQPLLSHVVSAAAAAEGTGGVVVVTSNDPSDDPIDNWGRSNDVAVWRGDLCDVAGRMLGAAKAFGAESFVRLSGDSPMIDPSIVGFAAERFVTSTPDLVTNLHPRSFPSGQSVEVVRAATLERLLDAVDALPGDREHVTPVLYRHEELVQIERFSPRDMSAAEADEDGDYISMTVDTDFDAELFRRVVAGEDDSRVWSNGWRRCQALLRAADVELHASRERRHD